MDKPQYLTADAAEEIVYNKAKRLQSQEAWSQYSISKNKIIEEINRAHEVPK